MVPYTVVSEAIIKYDVGDTVIWVVKLCEVEITTYGQIQILGNRKWRVGSSLCLFSEEYSIADRSTTQQWADVIMRSHIANTGRAKFCCEIMKW